MTELKAGKLKPDEHLRQGKIELSGTCHRNDNALFSQKIRYLGLSKSPRLMHTCRMEAIPTRLEQRPGSSLYQVQPMSRAAEQGCDFS